MLILSRKNQQKLVINKNIVITVTKIRGGRVRLGVDAPKDVTVQRGELVAKGAA